MIIKHTNGKVTVTFTLYGEVTPERLAREQVILKHRVEMLSEVKRPKRKVILDDNHSYEM